MPVALTPDGQLLDGRHRWRACQELGIEPKTEIITTNPWAYVVSMNLHRRHLSVSQLSMVGAKLALRKEGGSTKIKVNVPAGAVRTILDELVTPDVVETLPPVPPVADVPPTRDEVAGLLGVSPRNVSRARRLYEHGVPGLAPLVEEDRVNVGTAERITRLSEEEQTVFVEEVRGGADPFKVAPPDEERAKTPSRIAERENRKHQGRARDRYKYIRKEALEQVRASLYALGLLLENTEGLSPEITPEEIRQAYDDLSRVRPNLAKLMSLLKEQS